MSLITLNTLNSKEDKGSKIEYTYPAVRGVKMSGGKYSYQLNHSMSPNFTYSKPGSFRSGKAKTGYIVAANHKFGSEKTHNFELVIEHQTQDGGTFFVVLPITAGASSTLNKVVNSNNKVIGETLDLNTDIKNPTNIYNYTITEGNVFVFDKYINVNNLTNEKIAQYPFTPPAKPTVKYTTGNQKFSDEVVCGEEDVKAKPPSTDITYIFVMALFGILFLTMALMGMSSIANSNLDIGLTDWTTFTDLYWGKRPFFLIIFVVFLVLLSIFVGLYVRYNKEKKQNYKTIFGAMSVITTFIAVVALFMLGNTYAPPAPASQAVSSSSLGSRFMKSFKL